MAAPGKEVGMRDEAPVEHGGKRGIVLGDLIVRSVGTERTNTTARCFSGNYIRTGAHGVWKTVDLRSPETVVTDVGTSDLRRRGNIDYVMGEVCCLVATAMSKLSHCRLVLSGRLPAQ